MQKLAAQLNRERQQVYRGPVPKGKTLLRFSANLGFLWTDRPLPQAILAAKRAGFDAVECHWPYQTHPTAVIEALAETNLSMIGINTARGDADGFGLTALAGRQSQARQAIDQAIDYAMAIDTPSIHVMAGLAQGAQAHDAFCTNLVYACQEAAKCGKTILIEPINQFDAPGYFLATTRQAQTIIAQVGAPNLKMLFDCYHVARQEGDVSARLKDMFPLIGHIQFAGVPDRGPPDRGSLDYKALFEQIVTMGYDRPLGAEYRPGGDTDASLDWLNVARQSAPS